MLSETALWYFFTFRQVFATAKVLYSAPSYGVAGQTVDFRTGEDWWKVFLKLSFEFIHDLSPGSCFLCYTIMGIVFFSILAGQDMAGEHRNEG